MHLWRAGIKQALVRVPRPFDSPHASAPGPDSARVLIFGAGLAVGWGVTTHELALPGFLARMLFPLTGRGIDVDLVAHPDILLSEALRRVSALCLWRYDAIVVVLGINEALRLTSSKAWGTQLTVLLAELQKITDIPVAITRIQRIRSIPAYDSAPGTLANIYATALNRVSAEVCAAAPNAVFVPLPDFAPTTSDRYRSPDSFAESARVAAKALSTALTVPRHLASDPYPPLLHDDDRAEAQRQAAVDELDLSNPGLGSAIDQILGVARLSLTATAAMFTVLDRERQLLRASGCRPASELPRAGSLCDATIHRWGGMTIPDAQRDARFRNDPLVVGDPHIRFFAGFPVESSSGERIGALCVFDSEPRNAEGFDLVTLRNLALSVRRELESTR